MKNRQQENGAGVADKTSKDNMANLRMPANDSYQQSLYIAAISKSLGLEGLVSPVTSTRNGIAYTFDFYHPEAQQLFKVLPTFDEKTYEKYSKYEAQPVVILDGTEIPHQIKDCECGCTYMHITDTKIAKAIYDDAHTFIFHDGDLWKYRGHIDGEWTWKRVMPAVLREFVDEVDEEDDSED